MNETTENLMSERIQDLIDEAIELKLLKSFFESDGDLTLVYFDNETSVFESKGDLLVFLQGLTMGANLFKANH